MLEPQIIHRYFRKTIAHTEGAVLHHGDCDYFSIKVCTCGLHADLRTISSAEVVERLYPALFSELAEYEKVRQGILSR